MNQLTLSQPAELVWLNADEALSCLAAVLLIRALYGNTCHTEVNRVLRIGRRDFPAAFRMVFPNGLPPMAL